MNSSARTTDSMCFTGVMPKIEETKAEKVLLEGPAKVAPAEARRQLQPAHAEEQAGNEKRRGKRVQNGDVGSAVTKSAETSPNKTQTGGFRAAGTTAVEMTSLATVVAEKTAAQLAAQAAL